ncbi:class I SAM-dependent methyltransferase [Candidatus Geothermarchaeota archaeon]|nr:MAG: class I SAM-dependent methyltransferase [Candidatus Geothermarchaeota archaeon]
MSWKVFDEYVERYDKWFEENYITALNELNLIRSFDIEHPSLEVGVGTGFFSSRLNIDFGLDPSYNMLLKSFHRGVESIYGFGENLPFRESIFKTILIIVTLCFLSDPHKVLKEVYRVLVYGGRLLTCIVPRDSPWGKLYIRRKLDGHVFYRYARFYTVDEVIDLLNNMGFKVGIVRGILSYEPFEEPYIEEPSEEYIGKGFVCIESIK